jgi:hypothetical protein
MPTHTKTVFLPGTLRSADGQRKRDCKVQVAQHQTSVDELDRPAKVNIARGTRRCESAFQLQLARKLSAARSP